MRALRSHIALIAVLCLAPALAHAHVVAGDPAGLHHLVAHPPAGAEHGPMFVFVMVLLLLTGLCAIIGLSRRAAARRHD